MKLKLRMCGKCKKVNPMYSCSRMDCPINRESKIKFNVQELLKEDFLGSSHSIFVGRSGYPNVNVGILSPPERVKNSWLYDAPKEWHSRKYNAQDVIDLRGTMINSRFQSNIFDVRKQTKFLDLSKELVMAIKPTDLEINLNKIPKMQLNINTFAAPNGPNASLKNVKLTSNPKIPKKIDYIVSDTDLKASEGLKILYKKNFDENILTKILSVGNLGLAKNRKLVPTRFSITAVDDIVGKGLINEIKDYSSSSYLLFYGEYFGNHFFILCFPDVWSYELFETSTQTSIGYTTDYENYNGRKKYVEETAGGYYASRLAILEKLKQMKRQASVLVLRFIDPNIYIPIGVWSVREAARESMSSKAYEFDSKETMLNYVKTITKKKFNYNLDLLLNKSKLLENIKTQKKLFDFT